MKKLFSFLMVCMFVTMPLLAQKNISVSGVVLDKSNGEPVMQATVQLLNQKDSTFVAGNASDMDGKFNLPAVDAGNYLLKISYTGYVPEWKSLKLTDDKREVNVGTIAISNDAVLLKDATVTAQVAEVQVVEDTVVYNAGAYRLPPGSMLEELVKKMPGVQVDENGKITVNGKEVKEIMMNGKEFFSGDTELAMKNIPVEMVDKIKAYDRQSDLARITGIDDGEESTVLDLTVRKDMAKGLFGNVDAGYGTEDRYAVRGTFSRYNDSHQMTLVANANNVGGRGFPGGGMGGGFLGGGMGGMGGGGLTANKDAGFSFAFEKGNIELGGDVRYRHRDTDSRSISSSETFLQTGSSFSNSLSRSLGCSDGWDVNFRLEWTPDTLTNVIFRPRFSLSKSDSWSESSSATFNQDPYDFTENPLANIDDDEVWKGEEVRVNSDVSRSQNNSESLSASGTLQVNRRLNDEGRNITFVGSYSYGDSESEAVSASIVKYYLDKSRGDDIRNRYNVTPGNNWNYSAQLTYSEPIMKNTYLQFSYKFTESYNKNDRSTYDFSDEYTDYMYDASDIHFPMIPEDYKDYLDKQQSQFSEYYNYNHEAQAMLRINRDNYQFNVGFTVLPQRTEMEYKYLKMDTTVTRNVINFTPNVRFRYRWDKQTQLDVNYRGRSSQPSMTDMLDFEDDTNPLNITQGNPGLKPSFSHNLNANFRTYNMDKQQSIFGSLGGQLTQNNVSSKVTYIEETGGRITRPENINGNWSANGMFGFNTALPNQDFTISSNTDARYSNSVQYLEQNRVSKKNTTRTLNLGENLRGTFRSDWEIWQLEVSLNGRINYQHAENELQPDRNLDTYMFSYGGSTNITLPWNMTISTDLSMNSRRGYSDPNMNTNELIWNAQIAQPLFNGAATLSLQFYDILQEQSNISRTINASMRRDTETNAINSYCMVHFIYRLNIFGDGQNAFRRNAGGMGGFGGGMGGFGGGMGGFGGGMGAPMGAPGGMGGRGGFGGGRF